MTDVCIVILNWNGWEDTVACLKSVKFLKSTNVAIHTIVVDNASQNESVEKIQKTIPADDSVELIINSQNLGFAGGNNVGIKKALERHADYIMVLNNDTILDNNLVVNLVSFMNDHRDAGAVSPKMYFASGFEFHHDRYKSGERGHVIWYAGGDIDWKNVYGSNHGVDAVDKGQFEESVETTFASGACLFLRSSAIKQVGLFDEKYFLYLEDTDICLRLKHAGYKIYMVANAHLWHKVSQSSGIGSKLNDYFITRNRLLFASKYANLRANIALFRESLRFLRSGREWQKKGVVDYYIHKFGQGSWKNS